MTRPARQGVHAVAVAVWLVAAPLGAANEDWTPARAFRLFSKATSRGMPQSTVVALAQDVDGVLWLGTLDGLGSFDGRAITPVDAAPGAPVRGVLTALVARRKGGVYAGGSSGVHVYDGRGWRLAPSARGVTALAESTDGRLWMADVDGALWTLGEGDAWQRHTEVTAPVLALADAPDGAIWAGWNAGVVRLRDGRAEAVAGPLSGRPAALRVARDGRCWVATLGGTIHWARQGDPAWTSVALPGWAGGAFRGLAEDRRGRIWAGALGGRVAFGTADGAWTTWGAENGPLGAGVMSVLADREGSLWFGLNGVGLAQWVGEAWSHRISVDGSSLPGSRLAVFGITHGAARSVLVAAFKGGALRLTAGGVEHYGAAQGLTEDSRSVVEPEPGTLWVGARFGVFESRHGGRFHRTLELPTGFVTALFRSPQGRWYATTSTAGVFAYDGNAWSADSRINVALDDPHVRGMTWLSNGELWVATLRGVSVFRDAGVDRLTQAQVAALPESVNTVLEVGKGEIWAAGIGGIAVRRDGGAWRRITETDGIPGRTIYSLAQAPDGAIWAGGSGGVGRYAAGRWTVWDSRSGLLDEECNLGGLLVEGDGQILVGTLASLARFDPHVEPLPAPPLKLVWRKTPPLDGAGIARLGAGERSLRLRWSAAWLDPRPVQYRTRVPGLSGQWSPPTTEDHLDIENVTAGPWEVDVAARVEGADEWSEPLALHVEVAHRWHERWATRAALALLLVAAGVALARVRLQALRRHAARLEATVQERTAQLAEKVGQLQSSERRAQAASRAKSAFLANMSHELHTPLNAIIGYSEMLQEEAASRGRADLIPDLRRIQGAGKQLLAIIDEVLDLSKIETGRMELRPDRLEVRQLLNQVETSVRPLVDKNANVLIVDCPPEVGSMDADPTRLRQVLFNLLSNAARLTERGTITLAVRREVRDGEERVSFRISDTGRGLSSEDIDKLFQSFGQVDSTSGPPGSTSLGLAVTKRFCQMMGGDVEVESEPGKGSTFTVWLPVRAAAAAPAVAAAGVASPAAPSAPHPRVGARS
jgi:signal transduction histidine kinase/ligand-binding sensor domain-containing protein